MGSLFVTWKRLLKRPILGIGLVVLVLALAACQSEQPEATPAAEAPTPAEEQAAEEPTATEAPTEEPTATEAPTEEPTATEAPTEEPTATEVPAEEPTAEEAMPDAVANGEYIVTLTGGCGCHFNRELGALAGGNDFDGPFGVVYARNITPDPETGIGNWSPEEIVAALRTGARPDSTQLHPIMPYHAFSALSDQEAMNVAAYLLAQEPVANEVPARELANEPEPFTPDPAPPAEPPTDPVARGEELVTIARCSGCHTPSNEDGSPNMEMFLAGAPYRDDEVAANITPDEETGIGNWSEEEIAHFLQTAERPDGSLLEGTMEQQIDRRFSELTDEDAAAIAAFLKSIPAVSNDPSAE